MCGKSPKEANQMLDEAGFLEKKKINLKEYMKFFKF